MAAKAAVEVAAEPIPSAIDAAPKDIAVAQTPPPAEIGHAPDAVDNAKVQSIPNPARDTVAAARPGSALEPGSHAPSAPPAPVGEAKPPPAGTASSASRVDAPGVGISGVDAPGSGPRAAPAAPPAPAPSPSSADGRPIALAAARNGRPDDLKLIKGIGPRNEAACNALGVFHLDQIAVWSPETVGWVSQHLAFPGRVERESWVGQARLLSLGFDTPHASAVKSGTTIADADAPLSDADVAALRTALPDFAPSVENETRHAGHRPVGLAAARGGTPDDLQRIRGIGKQNEARLQALGIWHFIQISRWTPDNVQWVGSYLAFPGRITREDWITQAAALATGGTVAPAKPAAAKPPAAKPPATKPPATNSAASGPAVPEPEPAMPEPAKPEVGKPAARRRRP